MRRRVNEGSDLITRVNVVPIIDVALVLVIILLVTAPMISVADLRVNLPDARTREAEHERNVSVTLAADGRLALDDTEIAVGTLRRAVRARLAEPGNDRVRVVVRADSGAPYGAVRHVLDELRAAGAERVAIATRLKVEAGP